MMKYVFLWMVIGSISFSLSGQKQLVLLKRGHVVGNFPEGSYIHLILKNGTSTEGHIVELKEFSMIISADTIPFNRIKKVGIPKNQRTGLSPVIGKLLLLGGVLYFGIDQINSSLGYNPKGIDETVVKTSVVMVVSGSLLVFIRPHYRRVNMGTFLRTVDYKSPFYRSTY